MHDFVIPVVLTVVFILVFLFILDLILHRIVRKAYPGPTELTDLFADEKPQPQKRHRHTNQIKKVVLEEAKKHGMTAAVERYGYLGITRRHIARWQKSPTLKKAI